MKKILFFLLLLQVPLAYGQSKLRLGVNIDLMSTWLSPKTNNIDKDGARPGIAGGLMMEYYFSDNYGLVSGLNLGSQGGKLMYNDSVYISKGDQGSVLLDEGTTVAYSLSYLSLPIGLKLKTNEIGKLTYYAELGFRPQFNIGSRASSTGNDLNKDNVPEEINLFNLSYYFGVGAEYNIGGQTSLVAGLTFNNGFVDVLSNDHYKAVSNFLSLRIGVFF